MKSICVFCGSSPGSQPEYFKVAQRLGQILAENNIHLVYGGASVGIMGAVADATIAAGGHVIGVIPENLFHKEVIHGGLKDLRIVKSMHERKALMAELSNGFLALPGGFGTFEELFEITTWAQLGLHQKPIGILNTLGYYDPLLQLVTQGIRHEFIQPIYKDLLMVFDQPEDVVPKFRNHRPLDLPKWISEISET